MAYSLPLQSIRQLRTRDVRKGWDTSIPETFTELFSWGKQLLHSGDALEQMYPTLSAVVWAVHQRGCEPTILDPALSAVVLGHPETHRFAETHPNLTRRILTCRTPTVELSPGRTPPHAPNSCLGYNLHEEECTQDNY